MVHLLLPVASLSLLFLARLALANVFLSIPTCPSDVPGHVYATKMPFTRFSPTIHTVNECKDYCQGFRGTMDILYYDVRSNSGCFCYAAGVIESGLNSAGEVEYLDDATAVAHGCLAPDDKNIRIIEVGGDHSVVTKWETMPACPSEVPGRIFFLHGALSGYNPNIRGEQCKSFCQGFRAPTETMYYDISDSHGCRCLPPGAILTQGDETEFWDHSDPQAISGCLAPEPKSPGVLGDPHLVGARGERFDFNGELGKSFCLFTDKNLHINILLDGYYDNKGTIKSWIKAMAFLWKDMSGKEHSVEMAARKGKELKRGSNGFLERITADGVPIAVPKLSGDKVSVPGGFDLFLKKHNDTLPGGLEREVYLLNIDNVVKAEFHLKPEIVALRTSANALVHFDLQITKIQVTPAVHGILGQTYKTGFSRVLRAVEYSLLSKLLGSPVHADGESGAGILDGASVDYQTSGLTAADCKFAQAWVE